MGERKKWQKYYIAITHLLDFIQSRESKGALETPRLFSFDLFTRKMLAIWLALSPSYIKPRATYENAERHTHSARPTAIKSIGQCKTEHPTIIMWLYRWQLNELATTSYEMHMNCWNRFAGWIFGLFFSFEISVILHPDTQNTNSIDKKKSLSHSNVGKKKRISQIITIISEQMSWEFVCISLSCAYGVKLLLF